MPGPKLDKISVIKRRFRRGFKMVGTAISLFALTLSFLLIPAFALSTSLWWLLLLVIPFTISAYLWGGD